MLHTSCGALGDTKKLCTHDVLQEQRRDCNHGLAQWLEQSPTEWEVANRRTTGTEPTGSITSTPKPNEPADSITAEAASAGDNSIAPIQGNILAPRVENAHTHAAVLQIAAHHYPGMSQSHSTHQRFRHRFQRAAQGASSPAKDPCPDSQSQCP